MFYESWMDNFSIYHTDWLGSHTTDTAGRHTLEMTNSLGPQQIVTEPTRDDQILELLITDLVSTATTFAKLGTSGYDPILVKLQVPIYRDRPHRRRAGAMTKRTNGV